MAWRGQQPYDIRLGSMERQAEYHHHDICGSSFHGLATILEKYFNNFDFHGAREQVLRCIDARENEIRRRQYPDPAHNYAVRVLRGLLRKINYIIENITTLWAQWPSNTSMLVRYDEQTGFSIIINNRVLGGKIKKYKKTCKKCVKKTKTRKQKNKKIRKQKV